MLGGAHSTRAVGPLGRGIALLALSVLALTVTTAPARTIAVEKTDNLDIALRVANGLRAAGVSVTMTRRTDATVSLRRRTDLANRLGVDAFVSIHNNASSDRSARGSIVFFQLGNTRSSRLAADVRDGLRALGSDRPDRIATRRGDHGDYYFQLRETDMPAVLIETAFVTSSTEGPALATSPSFRQKIADAIVTGILTYQRSLTARSHHAMDPGTVVRSPLPAPTDGAARALGATRVSLAWTTGALASSYRIYRDGVLLAERDATPGRMTFTDVWAAPGQTYDYEIRSVRHAGALAIEGSALALRARTPSISIVLDPGHGGSDPGAIATF